jgi:hypothetical protein
MGRQLQAWRSEAWRSEAWRSEEGQNFWLSMLVDAMEQAARPELRSVPCDRMTLAIVHAQLARPASPYGSVSSFSLRN